MSGIEETGFGVLCQGRAKAGEVVSLVGGAVVAVGAAIAARSRSASQVSDKARKLYLDAKAHPWKAAGKTVAGATSPLNFALRTASQSLTEAAPDALAKLPPEAAIVAKVEQQKNPDVSWSDRIDFIKKDYGLYKQELRDVVEEFKAHPAKASLKQMWMSASPTSSFTLGEKASLFMAFRSAGKEGLVAEFMRIALKKPRLRPLNLVPVPNPVRYATLDRSETHTPSYQELERFSETSNEELGEKGKGWLASILDRETLHSNPGG